MQSYDENFMREALVEAKKAYVDNEVPVGAVLVYDGIIIARGSNFVEHSKDASQHAEMLCLKMASKVLSNWRLLESTLYCTLEPCIMCAGAMILSRVKRLVYGAKDLRHGAIDVLVRPHPIHQVEACGGVLEGESQTLMREFFREKRKEAKI